MVLWCRTHHEPGAQLACTINLANETKNETMLANAVENDRHNKTTRPTWTRSCNPNENEIENKAAMDTLGRR